MLSNGISKRKQDHNWQEARDNSKRRARTCTRIKSIVHSLNATPSHHLHKKKHMIKHLTPFSSLLARSHRDKNTPALVSNHP